MEPLEWTIVVNRKELPSQKAEREEKEQPNMDDALPEIYTSRYLAQDIVASGAVVPVGISMIPPSPLLPLSYHIEHEVCDLMPERPMYGEWRKFSPLFWRKLDHVGPEKIALRLATISAQHGGEKPLALLCYENLLKGQRCHRVIASAWWYEQTGWKMPELTNEGEVLDLHQLHRQVMPLRPR